MASKDSDVFDFEEILKRGSATEPRNYRPVPNISKPIKEDLSLNGAIQSNSKVGRNTLPLLHQVSKTLITVFFYCAKIFQT